MSQSDPWSSTIRIVSFFSANVSSLAVGICGRFGKGMMFPKRSRLGKLRVPCLGIWLVNLRLGISFPKGEAKNSIVARKGISYTTLGLFVVIMALSIDEKYARCERVPQHIKILLL